MKKYGYAVFPLYPNLFIYKREKVGIWDYHAVFACVHACVPHLNFLTSWLSFTKFGMNIMASEDTLTQDILIFCS
jgi:hypothetical protein